MKKVCVTGDKIQIGDILSGVWFFPDGLGVVECLVPFEGSLKTFAGEGSQVATIKGTDRKLTLPAVNWYIVCRQ